MWHIDAMKNVSLSLLESGDAYNAVKTTGSLPQIGIGFVRPIHGELNRQLRSKMSCNPGDGDAIGRVFGNVSSLEQACLTLVPGGSKIARFPANSTRSEQGVENELISVAGRLCIRLPRNQSDDRQNVVVFPMTPPRNVHTHETWMAVAELLL